MQQICKQCGSGFAIGEDDLAFYDAIAPVIGGKKQRIPPPTRCPDCRQQRRMAWRNEKKLYRRSCDLTGKQILSIYSPDKPYAVYEHREWYSDKWDPLSYGKAFDFSRPFFEQMDALLHAVPMRSVNLQAENENCEYTNLTTRNKNCYLIFAANDNEDCYYGTYLQRSKNLIDCFFTFDSEWCYECIDCYRCHRLRSAQYCENCSESSYLFSCKSCSECLGCVNLVQKSHHVLNKPYTKDEYEDIRTRIGSDKTVRATFLADYERLKLALPRREYAGLQNENVSGDHLSYSKNVHKSFDCTYLEDCNYCTWLHRSKECWDCYAWGLTGELGYENHLCGNNFYHVLFSESCWNDVSDLLYCRYCLDGCSHCFGCVSLRRKSYCILNRQYTKAEYEELVPRIIEHMRSNGGGAAMNPSSQASGSWGEFFPTSLSPYGYNETVAQEYLPLSKEEILRRGWKWHEEEKLPPRPSDAPPIPDRIEDVTDEICNRTLLCEESGKAYKIIPQELAFYRAMGIPIPRLCFDARHAHRLAKRNPRKLWMRTCGKCGKEIETTYAPDRPEIVYCESCYLKEVY